MKTKRLLGLVAAAACLSLSSLAAAQGANDDLKPLTDTWMMVPKAGMESKFEDSLRTHMVMRAAQGDPREWHVYVPVIGDKMNVYQIRSCCHDFADQDRYVAFVTDKGFSDHWNETVHQYVDHYHHYMERNDWKNSHMPEGSSHKYYGVTAWTIKDGAGMAWDQAREKLSQLALDKGWANDNEWLWLSRIGGKPMLMIATGYDDFADMAPPEKTFFEFVAEHMGSTEKAEKLMSAFSSGMASSSFTVWTRRADLSTPETMQGDD